jgi:hypothetical protein
MFFALALAVTPASAADSLAIQKLLFADDIAGLGQYTPHPARFTLDDDCWVYVEMTGFAMPLTPDTQDEYSLDLTLDVLVKLPQSGRKVAFQPGMAKLATKVRSKLPAQFLSFGFSFDGWTPGNYALEVGLHDSLGGQTVSQDLILQLVEPTEADTRARQEREAQQQQQQAPAPK